MLYELAWPTIYSTVSQRPIRPNTEACDIVYDFEGLLGPFMGTTDDLRYFEEMWVGTCSKREHHETESFADCQ